MGFDETDFVYKITVDGTDIVEYYDLEEKLPENQVRDMWLSDAEDNHGRYLSMILGNKVRVELLTDDDDGNEDPELDSGPIALPSPEDYDELI